MAEPRPAPRAGASVIAGGLGEVIAAMAEALTPQEVAAAAVDLGIAMLGAATGGLWLVEPKERVAVLVHSRGTAHELDDQFRELPLDGGFELPVLDALRDGRPVWVLTEEELARRYPAVARLSRGGGFGSLIACLPMTVEGRVIGVLAFTFDRSRQLSDEERLAPAVLVQHAAQSIARAQVFVAEREARAESERLRERAAFQAEASALLSSTLDLRQTLESLAHLAVPRFADWCVVELSPELAVRTGAGEAVVAHVDAAKVERARELQRRYPRDPEADHGVAEVLRSGRSELYPEVPDELLIANAVDAEHLHLLRELRLQSAMIVPLAARGRTLGVITFIAAESGRRYDDEELAAAEDLARRAALAVANAELYEEARAASRVREEFLTLASHELRNPLNAVVLGVAGLRRAARLRPESVTPDWVADKLDRLGGQVDRLVELVDSLLDVSRLAAGGLEHRVEEVDLSALVQEVIERYDDPLTRRFLLRVPPGVVGRWDRLRLDQAISNLVANAVDFGAERPVEIDLVDGDPVSLSVRDQGPGIAPEEQERIFDRFRRGAAARSRGGFGLGLWIARRAVEAHGGRLSVDSRPGEGASFRIELPRGGAAEGGP